MWKCVEKLGCLRKTAVCFAEVVLNRGVSEHLQAMCDRLCLALGNFNGF